METFDVGYAVSAIVELARSPPMKEIHGRNMVGYDACGVNAVTMLCLPLDSKPR